MKEIKVLRDKENIVVSLPIDTMIFAFEKNPNNQGSKITNKDAFVDSIIKALEGYQTQNSQELGITALNEFMDMIMDEAYINSEFNPSGESPYPISYYRPSGE